MPDDIRFVLEAPHVSRTQKKRPRLVTSCDNCRLKKIKCIQNTPDAVCEACAAAGVSCRFRDRERYYAERSRIAAAQALAAKNTADKSRKASSRERDGADPQGSGAESAQAGATRSPTRRPASYHPYRAPGNPGDPGFRSSPESDASTPPPLGPLFDPLDPTRPHCDVMMTFIQLFFDNLNVEYPFLAYDETIRLFFTHSLPSLLANCIAAHGVRYSELPEVTKRGVTHVSDAYCDTAKTLLAGEVEAPTLDTLHALILLAWAEHNRSRLTEFYAYGQMAIELAQKLGFSEQALAQMTTEQYERTILQATWTCVNILEGAVRNVSLF
ncbi:Zn(II)2Cys6 transcription factor [Phanerochaete sordida]|uniref:Zn(II)2Cys6 transcription factor n=1 Tax=Phanerochaete sordida TaxID=48140 RepID=A0A9P3GLR9_9APHY|nr:Zn(II)2Cys6 transcription factor [Phanerochaete sordida]